MLFRVVTGEWSVLDGRPRAPRGRAVSGVFRHHWFEWQILTEMLNATTVSLCRPAVYFALHFGLTQ